MLPLLAKEVTVLDTQEHVWVVGVLLTLLTKVEAFLDGACITYTSDRGVFTLRTLNAFMDVCLLGLVLDLFHLLDAHTLSELLQMVDRNRPIFFHIYINLHE